MSDVSDYGPDPNSEDLALMDAIELEHKVCPVEAQ